MADFAHMMILCLLSNGTV